MKIILIFASIVLFCGCASRPHTYSMQIGDTCVYENPPFRMLIVRDENGFALQYFQNDKEIFSAGAETNETTSMHFIRPWDGKSYPQGFMRIIHNGKGFVDHSYCIKDEKGTIEIYDSDGDGYPEKRLTSAPEFRLVESIEHSFKTNSFKLKK